jgi:hypothetical protein
VMVRTHVARNAQNDMIYLPEPEGATRLAHQLCQLAKGSARIGMRFEANAEDLAVVRRAAFDCIFERITGHVQAED